MGRRSRNRKLAIERDSAEIIMTTWAPDGHLHSNTRPGQSLAYVYSRKSAADAGIAGVLTEDEARRIALLGVGT
jgi:hypothetical protein